MRLPPLLLVLLVSCVERGVPDDTSTGQATDTTGLTTTTTTATSASDPTAPKGVTTGDLDNPAGHCSPVAQDPGACPTEYICCSDDPATTKGRIPNYFSGKDDDIYGTPIFSADNNALSHSGQCVDVGEFSSPFASGCPVPCNPTWDVADRDRICGLGTTCCQFQPVDQAKDCVLDPTTKKWRSVRGSDIGTLTTWGDMHATNQDPLGTSCNTFASASGTTDSEVLADCFTQLTVADQRGFCFQTCPCFEDLCDQRNPGWTPRCV